MVKRSLSSGDGHRPHLTGCDRIDQPLISGSRFETLTRTTSNRRLNTISARANELAGLAHNCHSCHKQSPQSLHIAPAGHRRRQCDRQAPPRAVPCGPASIAVPWLTSRRLEGRRSSALGHAPTAVYCRRPTTACPRSARQELEPIHRLTAVCSHLLVGCAAGTAGVALRSAGPQAMRSTTTSSVAGLFAGDQSSAHEIVHKLVVVANYSCGIPLTNRGIA